jgi:hypothetical protein
MGVRVQGCAKNIILKGLEARAYPYRCCSGGLVKVGPYHGKQRAIGKRLKKMELLAFLCVACLLAVEKDGMVWVEVRRADVLKAKTPASCWRPTEESQYYLAFLYT